jgi:hypothetical protein
MMQHMTKKRIEDISEADLQAVTGGCRTCLGVASIASEEAGKAIRNAERSLGTEAANRELARAGKLQRVVSSARKRADVPPMEGCQHCNYSLPLMQRASRESRP